MDDVKQVHESFDIHDIPFDVLWLDIEHTDGKRYFTWDPHKFSNPKSMINGLAEKGRKLVTIIDPHIKKDDNYKVYKEAKDNDYFIKSRDGGEYDGWCWPGSSADCRNSKKSHYYITFFDPLSIRLQDPFRIFFFQKGKILTKVFFVLLRQIEFENKNQVDLFFWLFVKGKFGIICK